MRARRATVVAGLLAATAALALASRHASADEPHVRASLTWDEATGCLDRDALARGVEAQLGRPVFSGAPHVRIVGRVLAPGADVVDVELELESADGTPLGRRTLHAAHGGCRALDRELVAVVGLLVDLTEEELADVAPARDAGADAAPGSDADAGADAGSDAGADAGSDAGEGVDAEADAGSDAGRPPPGLPASLVVGATAAVRALPGVAVGLRVGAELSPLEAVPVELGLALYAPDAAESGGGGATFWLWTARAGACVVARADVVELGGCAAVDAGLLLAVGYGLEATAAPLRPWVALSLRVRVGVRIGDVTLRLEPGLALPFVRDRFLFYDVSTAVPLFQPGVVAGTIDLVLAWRLGS